MSSSNNTIEKNYFPSAFFSAFTTLPLADDNEKLIDTISKIFEKYKEGFYRMQHMSGTPYKKENKYKSFLYKPVPYCVFGEFDMAIISMIDDFSFATQHFRPDPSSSFKYQVNTGVIPLIEAYNSGNSKMPGFRDQLLPDFFNKELIYPFTAIASVKLNNAMLVGIGQPFLKLINFFLINWLDERMRTEEVEKKGYKLFYILNENLGWNELAIYFFGNSLSYIQKQLMTVRQFSLARIEEFLIERLKEKKYDHKKIKDNILPIFKKIKKNSLLADLIEEEAKKDDSGTVSKSEIMESHPVIATSVTYGFHPDLIGKSITKKEIMTACKFTGKQYGVFKKECDRKDFIEIKWKIKPGHEKQANEVIKDCFPRGIKENISHGTQSGKYPFQFPSRPISFNQYLKYRLASRTKEETKSLHVIKVRSHLTWPDKIPMYGYKKHLHYIYNLDEYKISEAQFKEIADKLCVYPIPYTFKNQIENLIINYNDAIADPLMYNYFIGLKSSLLNFLKDKFGMNMFSGKTKETPIPGKDNDLYKKLIKSVAKYTSADKTGDDTHLQFSSLDIKSITEFIQIWNKAYWNRYFHSYYFTEINDFNIEHHGGIQQILFTYDTIYRLICRRIYGSFSKNPFINVQVVPMITSSQFYNTINFTHLFRPAIYACECVHEAANHIIPFLIKQCGVYEYAFLFDILNSKSGEEIETRREMENRLRIAIGPRDEYEKIYLNQHFGFNAIRHMVTDFCTYLLGYTDQKLEDKSLLWRKKDKESIDSIETFYHTHWFLFLVRTDLYERENSGKGYWVFNEMEFGVLFIRLNLMLYLFMDCDRARLDKLNMICPSVELNPMWESQKNHLLDFIERIGAALEDEFKFKTGSKVKRKKGEFPAIHQFRQVLLSRVLDPGWEEMKKTKEDKAFCEAISHNREIIKAFYNIFSAEKIAGEIRYNTIKRKSSIEKDSEVSTNVRFYEKGNKDIYLDPKGHLFSTSPQGREIVFKQNIYYIKKMWNLSMRISLKDYKDNRSMK